MAIAALCPVDVGNASALAFEVRQPRLNHLAAACGRLGRDRLWLAILHAAFIPAPVCLGRRSSGAG